VLKVLIVEDDLMMADFIEEILVDHGYDVYGDACLAKPYRSADLLRGLEIVAGIVTTGKAQPPFPRGFQLLHPAAIKSQAVGL